MSKKNKRYSKEFKQDAVNYYYSSGKSIKAASEKRQISVNRVLKKLGVSSSGYYSFKKRTVSNQELRKQSLLTEINDIYNESHQIYGAPKITALLRSRGHIVSEKTVGN